MDVDREDASKLDAILYQIIKSLPHRLNRTKIVKLCFIIDLVNKEIHGKTITGINYKYLLYGPYSDEIINSIRVMDGFEIIERENGDGSYSYFQGNKPLFDPSDILNEKELEITNKVIEKFGPQSLKSILDYVYNLDTMKKHNQLEIVLQ